jgi:predicted metal-dependent hydrolase
MTSVIAMVMAMAKPMAIIDWLKSAPPTVQIGDRTLPLAIRRLPQARRMTLRLAPDGSEVRISMPRWGRTDEAVAFARTRADWLARQLEALPSAESLGPGSTLRYRGNLLAITHAAKARRKPEVGNGTITIGGPEESMAARLQRWLESEARALLAQDLADYCARAAQPLPKIALSRAQRRWGSCSGKRMIRINWRLIMAPDDVRRSVVAHEVAHLVHFDHSPRFHALLGELFEGDIAEANHWLKREGRGLYAPFG